MPAFSISCSLFVLKLSDLARTDFFVSLKSFERPKVQGLSLSARPAFYRFHGNSSAESLQSVLTCRYSICQTKEKVMKKKLYLVRHGQTLFNLKHLIQGWCDSPLTELGRKQARAAAAWLSENNFRPDHVYCSTLNRTEQTAREISSLEPVRLDGLREFCYGELEGENMDTLPLVPGDPEVYYLPFGGEIRSQVQQRMMQTLQTIMEQEDHQNVLVISHGTSSVLFSTLVDPQKTEALRKSDNCAIYDFDYEDGRFILNDIINSHLKDVQSPSKGTTKALPDM